MARIFGGDQTEANTKRVVGTYGYMSPEYAMDGLFSVKSDVFSFGVLVLEIVSGKKNRGFYHSNSELNLLGHVWRLWREGKGLEITDSSVGDSFNNDFGGTYITFPARNGTIPFMLTLDHLGTFQSLIWCNQEWYKIMGKTTRIPGFKPMYPQDWFIRCVEKRKVGGGVCGKGDREGFLKLEGLKVPDARFSWVYGIVSLKECKKQCLKNCNCTGYANTDIHKIGGGCIAWFGELTDIRKFSDGQDFYLKVNAVELEKLVANSIGIPNVIVMIKSQQN
ncbi:hypothetical protein Q3G72_027519 [Acer saccharum]|nr:hypothetical protein Q3G72_027519 [Acer saccharum]